MDKEKIRAIGISKGVKELDLFVSFLSERFPMESNRITCYFSEWADRFNTGSPSGYMDEQSLKIYNNLKGKV